MKKQILLLFLALLTLAVPRVYGQDPPYLEPTELECIDLDNPLFVVAGREYTYSVDVPTPPPGTKSYLWFVTTDIDFITEGELTTDRETFGGSYLATGSTHYNDMSVGDTYNTINLTWQSFTLDATAGEYLFVVIYVVNDDSPDGCITDNLKVYRVQTQHAFTLDIANIDFNDGNSVTTDPVAVCVDDVQSAQFDPDADGGNGGVLYDFGSNEFYFVVAAANFSGAYHLRARLTNLQGGSGLAVADGQTAEIFWTDSWQDMLDNTDLSQAGPIDADGEFDLDYILAPEDLAVGQEGQMLYLKLVIYHNSFEATDIGGYDYTLAIDGSLAELVAGSWEALDPEEFGDQQNPDPLGGVCEYEEFGKFSVQTLLPRPTVESDPPGLLLPIAPTP
jgi:hypothetical protein